MKKSDNDYICKVDFFDPKRVSTVKKRLKPERTMQLLAETFKVLGDTTRVKILFALSQQELCVCDLAKLFDISKSAVSHQLRLLRNMRLVKYRKDGKMVYYSLDDDHIKNLFDECLRHVEEIE
ncbi:MAG: helix-turn-helix transcriptional regulator [Nitrospirae bacterium]|nr:helix-turn-helix transcriptional regulator [Nitrospirota bacterium]